MLLTNSKAMIRTKADSLVRRCGSRDPYVICEQLDIDIHYYDFHQKLKGYYFCQSRISNIVIDENIIDIFQRILIAHELGHHVLHRKIAMMSGFQELEVLEKRETEPLETEANLFAAELLIEDDAVIRLLSDHTFFETAQILGVPAALLDFKFSMLQDMGLFKNWSGMARADFLKEDLGAYDERNAYYKGSV